MLAVMSLLDAPSEYATADVLEGKADTLIAMYHGTIANSKVDSGLNIAHGLDWDTFAGYDIVCWRHSQKTNPFKGGSANILPRKHCTTKLWRIIRRTWLCYCRCTDSYR